MSFIQKCAQIERMIVMSILMIMKNPLNWLYTFAELANYHLYASSMMQKAIASFGCKVTYRSP